MSCKSSILHGTFFIAPSATITQHTCISNRLIVIVMAVISGGYKSPDARVCLPHNLTNCRGRSAALGLKSTLGIVWACPLKQERHPRLSSPYPRPTTTEIPSKWPVVPRDVTATARTRYEQFCLPPPPTDEHQDPLGAQKMAENGASGEEKTSERTYH